MGFFSELHELGIDGEYEIYTNNDMVGIPEEEKRKGYPREWEYLFEKSMDCPCCGIDFNVMTVRNGKLSAIKQDYDLRPVYDNFDPLKYEVAMCPICGYASLIDDFDSIIPIQVRKISDDISPKFVGLDYDGLYYTYDEAIIRYKMALLCDIVGYAKNGHKAYTFLKLSWLIRGMIEFEGPNLSVRRRKELEADEYDCIYNAYEGFSLAKSSQDYPICGMDRNTVTYLLAVLSYKLGKYEESAQYIYKIFTSSSVQPKIKSMAVELKDMVRERYRAEKLEQLEKEEQQ